MYYCNNCGGTLVGPTKQCPSCRATLREGGQGDESDRRTRQRSWQDSASRTKRIEAEKHREEGAWALAMTRGRERLETLQQYCGLMHLLTGDYQLGKISERLAWLAMDPKQRRGYVEPSWKPDSSSGGHRVDAGTPGRRTLLAIAKVLWDWRKRNWDGLVKAVVQPRPQAIEAMAQRRLYLADDDPDHNLQYLAAVLSYERLSRRQLTVRGRIAAVATSRWTWRLVLALAGAWAGYALSAHLELTGWWWAGLVVGVVAGLLLAGAAGRLIRRARALGTRR